MLFSSLEFLYLFLPITLVLYFLAPKKARNAVLLVVSLIFYAFGEPVYLFLMVVTILSDYGFGLAIAQAKKPKPYLVAAVVFNLALLAFFKYYDFLAEPLGFPILGVSLPIGISFYTFQALSYVIDVYRQTVQSQKSAVTFGAYVTLFPQLIAGPIVRYSDVEAELRERRVDLSHVAEGISRFCIGLSKKVLLANPAGALAKTILTTMADSSERTVLGAWMWLILFTFQIYFDFSGYSDMAIGLGKLLGFEFPENFNYPYTARSITDFWRRWHITLSTWFREYVYIPLGGNRRGALRTYRNLLITWALTGLWHGAAWNFLLWGLYFFLLLSMEKAFLGRILSRTPSVLCHSYALFFIVLGWLIFAADGSLAMSGITLAKSLFGIGVTSFGNGLIRYELTRNLPLLLIMTLGVTPLPQRLYSTLVQRKPNLSLLLRNLLCLGSLLLCTAYLADSGYNPFLYFRF